MPDRWLSNRLLTGHQLRLQSLQGIQRSLQMRQGLVGQPHLEFLPASRMNAVVLEREVVNFECLLQHWGWQFCEIYASGQLFFRESTEIHPVDIW